MRAMDRLTSFMRGHGFDLLLVILTAGAMVEQVLRQGSPGAPQTPLWFNVGGSALIILPLLARRRFPFLAPAGVWILAAGLSFAEGRLIVSTFSGMMAGLAAALLLGGLADKFHARIGLAVTLVGAVTVVYNAPHRSPVEFIFIPLLFAVAWLSGLGLQERAERAEAAEERAAAAEREREAAARVAVAEERARIARELHDVVAHSVSVMVLQVGAVRHDLPATLEADREALERVEQAGRTAVTEMRRLLGAMRSDGDSLELAPQPAIGDLDSLLDQLRRAGLPVTLHLEGDPCPLPRGVELSAYRIVQEGLTNALKHAQATQADVTVRYAPDCLHIEVRDDGGGAAASDGLGHGLVGIRERVKIYGGEMSAGSAPGGGFVLTARLPFGSGER